MEDLQSFWSRKAATVVKVWILPDACCNEACFSSALLLERWHLQVEPSRYASANVARK